MAQYGFNIETISRLKGGSTIGALSYLFREKLYDERNDMMFDYTKSNDFICAGVLLPDNAPPELKNTVTLCTAMEDAERRYDARVGRWGWMSLPNELGPDEWKEIAEEVALRAFVSLGMCVIYAIHLDKNPDDPTKDNPNAHFILTDRPVDREGFCSKKDRFWNKKSHMNHWRKHCADVQNELFKRKGLEVQISHESLEVQGIDREPSVPLGRVLMELEKQGIRTSRGDINRAIDAQKNERKEQDHQQQQEIEQRYGHGYSRSR